MATVDASALLAHAMVPKAPLVCQSLQHMSLREGPLHCETRQMHQLKTNYHSKFGLILGEPKRKHSLDRRRETHLWARAVGCYPAPGRAPEPFPAAVSSEQPLPSAIGASGAAATPPGPPSCAQRDQANIVTCITLSGRPAVTPRLASGQESCPAAGSKCPPAQSADHNKPLKTLLGHVWQC